MANSEELKENNRLLKDQVEEVGYLDNAFKTLSATISSALSDAMDEMEGLDDITQKVAKSYQRDITNSIKKFTSGIEGSVQSQLKLNKGLDISKDINKQLEQAQARRLVLNERINQLRIEGIGDFSKEQQSLEKQFQLEENRLKTLQKYNDQIQSTSGVKLFGGLEDISKAIPGLSKFTSIFKDASKASKEQAASNLKNFGTSKKFNKKDLEALKTGKGLDKTKIEDLGLDKTLVSKDGKRLAGAAAAAKAKSLGITEAATKSISPIMAGIKSIGPALAKALGPLALLKGLVDAFLQSDKIVGDMAKGLNMSYGEALDMKQELTAAAGASGELFVTSKGMAESLMTINKTLGTNVMLNKEDLVTFTKLREVAGLTNEELMGIQSLTLANGKSLEDNTKEILAQAKISSVKNGVILNEKEILKEVKDVSAATTLSLGKNPALIAEAVATAKSLGIEMAQIEGIVSSLLDFESSIESELQAELLLGKNINLEKARLAALNNDIATLSKEIANQIGDSADFSKMNRLQQDALAKSVGMNREELAKTLFIQDQLAGATGKEAEEKRRLINAQIESNGLAATQKKLGDEGFESLEKQASVQDRFNQSVEKLKEVFVNIAEVTMPFFSGIANMVGMLAASKYTLMGITGVLAAMSVIWTAIQIKSAIAALSTLTMNSALTLGVGAAAAIAAVGAAWATYESMKPAGDLNSPAKGKTQISTKEGGLFELSPNDDIVAAPGASQALAQANQGQQPTVIQNDNKETNMLLKQILNKQGTVKMNATEVGTAFSVNTYEVQ